MDYQAARNLFLPGSEASTGGKMLVQDRAGQFTASFDETFHTEGIRVEKTPSRTPVANCYTSNGGSVAYAASSWTGASSGTRISSAG